MKGYIKLLLLGLLAVFFLSGCDWSVSSVSSSERLSQFASNLNTESRTSTYTHIHSGVAVYDQIKTENWWEARQFSSSNNPFVFNVPFVSEINGIITHSGTVTYNSNTYDIIFTFREESLGDNVWMIYSINLDGSQIF